jgi:hypothetical protein
MIIGGCDYHPSFQLIAYVGTETGEWKEQRLEHRESAEAFYRELASRGEKVRVGMEGSGQARWFERLLAELGIERWLGDAAVIRAKRGRRKPMTDRLDAQHILHLMLKEDFPKMDTELGKPGPAATVVAPARDGAGTHTDREPTASGGTERRLTLQE